MTSAPVTMPRTAGRRWVALHIGLLLSLVVMAQLRPQAPATTHAAPGSVATATPTPTLMTRPPTRCTTSGPLVVNVRNARQLRAALADARPGTTIHLADGIYDGTFQIRRSGTAAAPITLCGSQDARLRGASITAGYGILLVGDYWHIEGITIHRYLKGIEAHGTTGSILRNLTIDDIGQEGIHLRDASTNTIIEWSTITNTGKYRAGLGEGIYIGSDSSQWCDANGDLGSCRPDASNGNIIQFNTIGPRVSAELIDIKEGTSGGIVRGNTLRGAGAHAEGVNALVSIKGNDWLIIDNIGDHAPEHGLRVNTDELAGWGTGNVFIGNTLDVRADGYGIRIPIGPRGVPLDNTVGCTNRVTHAKAGFANVPCTSNVSIP